MKILLVILFSSQISALTDTSTKILCVDQYKQDIVFEIVRKDGGWNYWGYIKVASEYRDGLKTKTKEDTFWIVKENENHIIAEDTLIDVSGMRIVSYKFLKDESNDIKEVRKRILQNSALFGNDNLEKRIEVSVKDSSFLANCI